MWGIPTRDYDDDNGLVTLTIVLLKRPVHVIEDRNLSDLRWSNK